MKNWNFEQSQNVKGGPLCFFNIHPITIYELKLKGRPFGDIKRFGKSLTKPKKGAGKSLNSKKFERGLVGFFFFQLRRFCAFKVSD